MRDVSGVGWTEPPESGGGGVDVAGAGVSGVGWTEPPRAEAPALPAAGPG